MVFLEYFILYIGIGDFVKNYSIFYVIRINIDDLYKKSLNRY